MKIKLKRKIEIILAVILMLIMSVGVFTSTFGSNSGITVGGNNIQQMDQLGYFIKNGGIYSFLNENPGSFLGKQIGLRGNGEVFRGIYYSTTQCLYGNKGNSEYNTNIVDVIDFYIGNDGKYYMIISDRDKGMFGPIKCDENASNLAAAIFYISNYTNDGYTKAANGKYNINDTRRYLLRKYYNAFKATYGNYIYSGFNYKNDDNYGDESLAPQINALGNVLKNYQRITRTADEAEVISQSENEFIIGPFNINYGGTNLESVQVKGLENAAVLWSTNPNSDWKQIQLGNNGIYASNGRAALPRNTNFYLKVSGDINRTTRENGKIIVTFKQLPVDAFRARMILTYNDKNQDIGAIGALPGKDDNNAKVVYEIEPGTPKPELGTIVINKTDSETKQKLNIGFKVQVADKNEKVIGWLRRNSDGSYTYNVSNISDATEYTTPNGTQSISNLSKDYKYKLWETRTASDGYKLEDQPKYNSELNAVDLSGWVSVDNSISVNAVNIPIKIVEDKNVSISGYVWVDKTIKGDTEKQENGTVEVTDSLYKEGTNDRKLEGVTVKLFKNKEQVGKEQKTNKDGEYRFDGKEYNILKDELKDYCVVFDYSNLEIDGVNGKKYIPVAYNSQELKNVVANGSRAMMNSVPVKDSELTGIALTSTSGFAEFAESSVLYNSSSDELQNINLGIKQIYDPDYRLTEDLKYVKIAINNHQYVYQYGKKQLTDAKGAPRVGFESPSLGHGYYERAVYPSDIYHLAKNENSDSSLKVYAIYEMHIYNTTEYYNEELYKEQELHITSLSNTFDTNRYTVAKSSGQSVQGFDLENKIQGDFDKWTEEDGTAKYNEEIVVKPGEATTKYIQFSVKPDEIKRILDNPNGLDEKTPTTAHSSGYHKYTRKDYSWNNVPTLPKDQEHESELKEKQDSAPYLRFKLGDERRIAGTVFEDRIDMTGREEGEVLGNGRRENGESPVSGVIVELVTGSDYITGVPATRYNSNNTAGTREGVKTDNNGQFELQGILPGEYFIRLTYGDGTQKIVDSNGTVVTVDDYKSTIVTSDVVKNALGYGTNNFGKEWYKHLEGDNYSVAIDNLDRRAKHNSGDRQASMIAGTAQIDITIENTESNYVVESDENGTHVSLFQGFNFGIIKQPEQKVEVIKKITNAKLVNTQQNVLMDGNPEVKPGEKSISGLTDLDGKTNGGSLYTRMEVEEDSIYGSELTLTYNITVANNSDKNYYEIDKAHSGWYYLFGLKDASYSRQVEIKVNEIIDCYDQVLTPVIKENSGIEEVSVKVTAEGLQDWGSTARNNSIAVQKAKVEAENKSEDKTKYDYKKVLVIKGCGNLAIGESKSMSFNATKLLATNEDLDFLNIAAVSDAEIITPELTDAQLQYLKPVETSEPSEIVEATVTTPTGSDAKLIGLVSGISGIVILSIIATGIIIIKRRK